MGTSLSTYQVAILRALLEDFKWMLEQHPEHDNAYARDRIRLSEDVLSPEPTDG